MIENQQRIDDMAPFYLIAYNRIDNFTENIPQSSTNIQINKWVEARNIKVRMSIQIESENKTIESNV